MSKWIMGILYGVLIFILGSQLYSDSLMKRSEEFYKNEVLAIYEKGEIAEIVDKSMISWNVKRYNKNALFHYQSDDEDYKFDIKIYSFVIDENKKEKHGLMIYLYNFDFKSSILKDSSVYEQDKSKVELNLLVMGKEANSFIEEKVLTSYNNKALKGSVIGPFYIENNEDFSYPIAQQNSKKINQITSIELSLIDYTKNNDGVVLDSFVKLENDDNLKFDYYRDEKVVKNDKNILHSNKFNGNASYYNALQEKYANNDDNIINTNLKGLSKYNGVIFNSMVLFGSVVVFSVFLLFFLKPLTNYFINRKKASIKKA